MSPEVLTTIAAVIAVNIVGVVAIVYAAAKSTRIKTTFITGGEK